MRFEGKVFWVVYVGHGERGEGKESDHLLFQCRGFY